MQVYWSNSPLNLALDEIALSVGDEQFYLDALIFAEPDSMAISQSVGQIPELPIYGLLSLGLIGLLISRQRIWLVRKGELKSLET